MLTEEQNRTLTQTGPGTPMGDLLRRYWQPVAAAGELAGTPVRPLRLLSEDLVLYRDQGGRYGLVERACAHRLTDLAHGISEQYGLRCPLHGWLYNEEGRCLEMPWEREPYLDEVQLVAYPVQLKAGLLWAYLGPAPAPLLPDWEPFTWGDGLVQIVLTTLDCNWLQCQESTMDLFGTEWLQRSARPADGETSADAPFELQARHAEFEYGFHNRVERGAGTGRSMGLTSLWPNGVFSGDRRSCRFEWRVPLEDERTLDVAWFFDRASPGHSPLPEQRYRHWYGRLKHDEQPGSPYIASHVLNRRFKLWLTTKKTLDRTKEHLVDADAGIVLLRNRYFTQLDVLADGGRPKGLIRREPDNRAVPLPLDSIDEDAARGSEARPSGALEFPYIAGQPPEVEALYRQVRSSWSSPLDSDEQPAQNAG